MVGAGSVKGGAHAMLDRTCSFTCRHSIDDRGMNYGYGDDGHTHARAGSHIYGVGHLLSILGIEAPCRGGKPVTWHYPFAANMWSDHDGLWYPGGCGCIHHSMNPDVSLGFDCRSAYRI